MGYYVEFKDNKGNMTDRYIRKTKEEADKFCKCLNDMSLFDKGKWEVTESK